MWFRSVISLGFKFTNMNPHLILSAALLIVAISTKVHAVCLPNTVCTKARDTIIQLDSSVLDLEKMRSRGRAWYIQPETAPENAILAFKNFSSTTYASVMVIAYTSPTEKTAQYFYGDLGNFEVVLRNAIGIIIYVPINNRQTANFILNYYTGCDIMTFSQDQISYPQPNPRMLNNTTRCWFIKPRDFEERKRIYFSIRDVALNEGQQIAIWDIHTSNVIATTTDGEDYKMIASETLDHQSVLVDLICTNDSCSDIYNSFYISYYAITQADVACIEVQKLCTKADDIPFQYCNVSCPAFDNILIEEFGMEVNMIVPRSGEIMLADEEEEEEEEEETDPNETTPRRACPARVPKRFCGCPKSVKPIIFCRPNISCFSFGPCTFACIFHKVATCLKITLLKSLKLL